jgi:hypothetical protein
MRALQKIGCAWGWWLNQLLWAGESEEDGQFGAYMGARLVRENEVE